MRTSVLTVGAVSSVKPLTRVADPEKTPHGGPTQREEEYFLTARVELALRATGHWVLRGVIVTTQARAVVLTGRVPSYYLKQVAQSAALAVAGTHLVRNEIAVVSPG